jgi:hypothetical protein
MSHPAIFGRRRSMPQGVPCAHHYIVTVPLHRRLADRLMPGATASPYGAPRPRKRDRCTGGMPQRLSAVPIAAVNWLGLREST